MTTQQKEIVNMNRIRWKEQTYLVSEEDLGVVFSIYGKVFQPCQMGGCGHVELVPSGYPNGFNQKCVYQAEKDLGWEVSNFKGIFSQDKRCFAIDETLKEYISAGHFNEFKQ